MNESIQRMQAQTISGKSGPWFDGSAAPEGKLMASESGAVTDATVRIGAAIGTLDDAVGKLASKLEPVLHPEPLHEADNTVSGHPVPLAETIHRQADELGLIINYVQQLTDRVGV